MKAIFFLAFFTTSAFAAEFVSKIQTVLPFGYYQGVYCSVSIGSGFANQGVSTSINESLNDNYFSTTMSMYENSPWTKILDDNSGVDFIDIKAKDNRDVVQRLQIKDGLVSIQLLKGRRVQHEVSCQIME